MKLRVSVVSVTVLTLLFSFLVQEDVKAQTTVNICNRTPQVEAAILAAIDASQCSSVPSAQLAAITTLDLSSGITALRAGDFSGLTNLETLSLHFNQLSYLPSEVFDNLTSLEKLDLHNNGLSELPPGVFDTLTNLESLDCLETN